MAAIMASISAASSTTIRNSRSSPAAWAEEEVQHGRALAAWAELADPGFDFEAELQALHRRLQDRLDSKASVRGSRAGELVARCIVETGTSSYYAALKEATEEPVLKEICRNIAADELRHYKLFYDHLRRYLSRRRSGAEALAGGCLSRMRESEDDELSYAYFAANEPEDAAMTASAPPPAYIRRAYSFYRPRHVERGVAMALKAAGLKTNGRLHGWLTAASVVVSSASAAAGLPPPMR